jgi:hypothetical protein
VVYEFKYLTKEDKTVVLERRQKTNEYDMYEFQIKVQELEQASEIDADLIAYYNTIINDKMVQISMLESMILAL